MCVDLAGIGQVALSGGGRCSWRSRRRPVGPHSPFVHRLLRHLEDVGFDAAPRLLGTDDEGRGILGFQHGEKGTDFRARDWSRVQITAAAHVLLRTFLDAYGLEEEGRRGFGERVGARGEAERDMRDRAGRVTSPGSWVHLEIDWPKEHADAIDRYVESRT
ncbi:hypothetical protein [Streptomyces olivaceoviridis]|uniref:hypothetical protein n=1 Tax=Streptomyces olivaceoviridis TaxID=1921 RepID=UPI0037A4D231